MTYMIILLSLIGTLVQNGTVLTLRYPAEVQPVQTCVESEGADGNTDWWYHLSCWKPQYAVEDYPLRVGTKTVRGYLTIQQDGKLKELSTPTLCVRTGCL